MADLLARGPIAFAGGFFGPLDQPARGDKLLHAWKAMNIVDLIQPHECAELADPWDRAQAVEGLRLMRLGRPHEIPLEVSQQAVISVDQCEVQVDALLDGRLRKAFGHAIAVRFVGQLLADLGQVILAVRLLEMGQSLGPCAGQMHAAPEEVSRGPYSGGIDIRLGEHPAPQ
jgi:hypothetical protein